VACDVEGGKRKDDHLHISRQNTLSVTVEFSPLLLHHFY
jgi:hypothetical protein